jgi:hypothetical protein
VRLRKRGKNRDGRDAKADERDEDRDVVVMIWPGCRKRGAMEFGLAWTLIDSAISEMLWSDPRHFPRRRDYICTHHTPSVEDCTTRRQFLE